MRPRRAAGLLAAIEAAAPARIARRVKETPRLADGWAWTRVGGETAVVTDDVTVRLAGDVVDAGGVTCSCLLAPKCVHILAVISVLEEGVLVEGVLEEGEPAAASAEPAPAEPAPVAEAPYVPNALVARAGEALAAVLAHGAQDADVTVRAELARIAYEARAEGLHRLARAVARVVRSLRLLDAAHPTFVLHELVTDLGEALFVARGLGRAATPALVGEARRTYLPVGTLRLWGVFSEPILAAGQAGVVTWLADARGALWHVSDVRPRAPGQAAGVYGVAPPLTTLSHQKLAREGLFVQNATAASGRLGAGSGVSAVRATGVGWSEPPLGALWASERPPVSRVSPFDPPDPADLRFLSGEVLGLQRDGLLVSTPAGPVRVLVGSEHMSLPWRDNLRLLARAPGLPVRIVGRPARRGAVVGLALASDALALPADWAGRVNLGLDRLTTAHVPTRRPEPAWVADDAADSGDPVAPLRRRVERAALGGAASLPGEGRGSVMRDATRMREALAITGADVLVAMAEAAGKPGFAEAWLSAAVYCGHVG